MSEVGVPTAEEVEHALLVRDLAAAYFTFDGGGYAQHSARLIITSVAVKKVIPFGSRTPSVSHIRKNYPDLWKKLEPFR